MARCIDTTILHLVSIVVWMLALLTLELMSIGLTMDRMSYLFGKMKKSRAIRSPQDLGVLIAQARRGRGQSQRDLAAEFGVSQAWISRVEQGYQKTWIGQVFRLAVYLGIEMSAETGMTGDDPQQEDTGYPDLDSLV